MIDVAPAPTDILASGPLVQLVSTVRVRRRTRPQGAGHIETS